MEDSLYRLIRKSEPTHSTFTSSRGGQVAKDLLAALPSGKHLARKSIPHAQVCVPADPECAFPRLHLWSQDLGWDPSGVMNSSGEGNRAESGQVAHTFVQGDGRTRQGIRSTKGDRVALLLDRVFR